ncbi:Integrase, catalytic region (plasmid) [Nitrobacter hamburgensis X14]|uniref:Integrase, catalytic region n=1 Tax=Nitrobacter hamburgensis (strain DSM 10229 / NCIMB 13809 / X14) TaxID=323097 RepID=Q1QFB0_NITHX|nr:Mu transposase C-terminal domain-containing protein [Nitrobacter hamburgensis]ABE65087.1 Integrase, catalytic region [Nitrobacter hamburgensis X14]
MAASGSGCGSRSVAIARDDAWAQAKRQVRELDRILDGQGPRQVSIARAAAELGLTTRHIYNLLKRYAPDRRITVLLPRRDRPRATRLTAPVEAVIAEVLREQWLVKEGPELRPCVGEIRARCCEAGERPPSYRAVQRRIPMLFEDLAIAKGRSANPSHARRLKARPGYISARGLLDVGQIDHTPADIQFVEVIDGVGVVVGRPYLTVVIDVFSRAILGFCLTLEKPSSLSVALCLQQALTPKAPWLAAHGLGEHDWPMSGRPRVLVVDRAKEFKGHAFARGCDDFGITIRPRHKGNVHQGGVIERLLGALNTVLRTLPGQTGRSVTERDHYPSEARARLSFADLERCVALAVLEHNAKPNEKTLDIPDQVWRAHAAGLPPHQDDPDQVLIAFLPGGDRRLTPQGVSVNAIDYYAPWLGELVPRRDRVGKLAMRTDPRDLSHIYLRHPDTGAFLAVERRDGRTDAVTLWEHEHARAIRRALGGGPESRIALRRALRAIADGAMRPAVEPDTPKPGKHARRQAARTALAHAAPKPHQALASQPARFPDHPVRARNPLPVEDW